MEADLADAGIRLMLLDGLLGRDCCSDSGLHCQIDLRSVAFPDSTAAGSSLAMVVLVLAFVSRRLGDVRAGAGDAASTGDAVGEAAHAAVATHTAHEDRYTVGIVAVDNVQAQKEVDQMIVTWVSDEVEHEVGSNFLEDHDIVDLDTALLLIAMTALIQQVKVVDEAIVAGIVVAPALCSGDRPLDARLACLVRHLPLLSSFDQSDAGLVHEMKAVDTEPRGARQSALPVKLVTPEEGLLRVFAQAEKASFGESRLQRCQSDRCQRRFLTFRAPA